MERLGGDVTGLLSRPGSAGGGESNWKEIEIYQRRIRHSRPPDTRFVPLVMSLTDGRWRKMISRRRFPRTRRPEVDHPSHSRQLMRHGHPPGRLMCGRWVAHSRLCLLFGVARDEYHHHRRLAARMANKSRVTARTRIDS